MSFNSIQFVLFFTGVVFAYFALPHRWRWLFLLLASYYFYMCWKPVYAILLFSSTVIDYVSAIGMGNARSERVKRIWLLASLCSNLSLLFTFKYFNFFSSSVSHVFQAFDVHVPVLNVLLPVGISFYTFQSLSYTVDVYRGAMKPERHFGIFALYVSFFPQLVAGPIERSTHLLPQFREEQRFQYEKVREGLLLILWGFFKKLVIADRAAVAVNAVYNNVSDYSGVPLIVATYLFAFQIYCDFSAYSDIARGSARILGFELMRNFDRPYGARSIAEFWRRWHISLSTWFRDYVYIPLGGNRCGVFLWMRNIVVTFFLSGLWHGANWTFVLWGTYHGLLLLGERACSSWWTPFVGRFSPRARAVGDVLAAVCVFHLVLIGWALFRANSIADAGYIFTHVLSGFSIHSSFNMGLGIPECMVMVAAIAVMFGVESPSVRGFFKERFFVLPVTVRWTGYYVAIFSVLLFGYFNVTSEFIYFQF